MNTRWIVLLTAILTLAAAMDAPGQIALTPAPSPTPKVVIAHAAARATGELAVVAEGQAPVAEAPQAPKVRRTGEAPPVLLAPPAPPAPPVPPVPPAPPVPTRRASQQLVNVKVEVTITDQVGAKAPDRKNIMMLVADGERASIRSNAVVMQRLEETVPGQTPARVQTRSVPLAVDVIPEIEGTKIRLRLSLEYDLLGSAGPDIMNGQTSIRESLSVVVESGTPLTIALSADPLTDRKVTLDVKATILR